jgi:hypothetical protein
MTDSSQNPGGMYSKLLEVQEKKKQQGSNTPPTQPVNEEIKPPTEVPTKKSSNRDTTVSRHHDTVAPSEVPPTIDDAYIEEIRKAVKQLGEKAATHRFTGDEKDKLSDIVFAYKKKGTTTSENELTRIAVNYMLYDYHKNKQSSIIATVLERLHG